MPKTDDDELLKSGYKPELNRGLGYFSSFSISFSYMSVLTGIVANFAFVLNHAGYFGIWTWVIVALGHTFTALIFAEMVARIPLTGSSYNWNSKLFNPTVGWCAGWMALTAYTVGVSAVTVTLFPTISSMFEFEIGQDEIKYLGVFAIIVQTLINVYSVKIAAYFNIAAVFAELFGMSVFGVLILLATLAVGDVNVGTLLSLPQEPTPYLPGFLMACLLASWTLLGFEGAADIAEETIDVKRIAPKAILHAILICSIFGFLFLLILALAAPATMNSAFLADPVTSIVQYRLGDAATKLFLTIVFIAIFACALVNMTGASRLVYAMSRDGRFPMARVFRRVSKHKVPHYATWLISGSSSAFLVFSDTSTSLYGAGAVLFALFYLTTVIGYLFSVGHLPPTSSFSLGGARWVVGPLAIAWHIFEIGVLTVPEEFHPVALSTLMIIVIGCFVFSFLIVTKRMFPAHSKLH